MINFDLFIFISGLAFLGTILLTPKLQRIPLSLPMLWLAVGLVIPFFTHLPKVDPIKNGVIIERLTEIAVIISILSAGLKLDKPLGWKSWNDTWRLLAITMPLSILLLMLFSLYITGLPLAAALLLGAVMAPTDPVLASDVQVGPPGEGSEHNVRFALTSEAGLNDGLAFPFVMLAILLVANTYIDGFHWLGWLGVDLFYKIAVATVIGVLSGYATGSILLHPKRNTQKNDVYIAVALTFLSYGAAQLLYGYGFLAVFVAAYVFRHYDRDHASHTTTYNFAKQIEGLIIPFLLMVIGVFISQGIFVNLSWLEVLLAFIFLAIVRPLSSLIGLIGSPTGFKERVIIAVFGIRGIGSLYYLAFALNHVPYFSQYGQTLWRISLLIILISIVLHGIAANLVFVRNKNL